MAISASTSNVAGGGGGDEQRQHRRFLRAYSEALADALKSNANDDAAGGAGQTAPSADAAARRTYASLCHDDPVVSRDGDGGCRLLSEALVEGVAVGVYTWKEAAGEGKTRRRGGSQLKEERASAAAARSPASSGVMMRRRGGGGAAAAVGGRAAAVEPRGMKFRGGRGGAKSKAGGATSASADGEEPPARPRYALSDRLVAGILRATERQTGAVGVSASVSASPPAPALGSSDDGPAAQSFAEGSNIPATAEGYALLYYAAFVRGPLLCLRSAVEHGGDDSDDDDRDAGLEPVRRFLGSWEAGLGGRGGSSTPPVEKEKEEEEDARVERLLEGMRAMGAREAREKAEIAAAVAAGEEPSDDGAAEAAAAARLGDDEKEKAERRQDSGRSTSSGGSLGIVGDHGWQQQNGTGGDDDDDDGEDEDRDSTQEIFADESDPDDYEFDSSRYDDDDGGAATGRSTDVDDEASCFGAFDPTAMSSPPDDRSLGSAAGCRARLDALLSDVSYARLSPLSTETWEDLGISETLAELALRLLKAELGAPNSRSGPLLVLSPAQVATATAPAARIGGEDCINLARRWHLPLAVLRDRALDPRRRQDALGQYLSAILGLLSCPDDFGAPPANLDDAVALMLLEERCGDTTGRRALGGRVSRTKAVGLGGLSYLCGPNGIASGSPSPSSAAAWSNVRATIADAFDDLSDAVEMVLPPPPHKGGDDADISAAAASGGIGDDRGAFLPGWVDVTVHVLPVLQHLTSVRCSDLSKVSHGGGSGHGVAGITTREAQALLSSGLFRHLIVLYVNTAPPQPPSQREGAPETRFSGRPVAASSTASVLLRSHLLRSVLVLCAQSPSALGRYAFRVPDFAALMTTLRDRRRFAEKEEEGAGRRDRADDMLWGALSLSLGVGCVAAGGTVGATPGGGRLRLRKKGPATKKKNDDLPLTTDAVRIRCRALFAALCEDVCDELTRGGGGGIELPSFSKGGGDAVVDGRRDGSEDDASADYLDPPFGQFVRLARAVEGLPSLGAAWASAVVAATGDDGSNANGGKKREANPTPPSEAVALVRCAVAALPVRKSVARRRDAENTGGGGSGDDGDGTEKERGRERKPKEAVRRPAGAEGGDGRRRWSDDEEVAAVRRAAKVITLLLESCLPGEDGKDGAGVARTNAAVFALTSKAD